MPSQPDTFARWTPRCPFPSTPPATPSLSSPAWSSTEQQKSELDRRLSDRRPRASCPETPPWTPLPSARSPHPYCSSPTTPDPHQHSSLAMPGSSSQGRRAPGVDRPHSPATSLSRRLSSQSLHLDVEGLDLGGSQSSHFSGQTKVSHGSPALTSEAIPPTKPRSQRGWKAAPQMVRGGRGQDSGSGGSRPAVVPVDIDMALAAHPMTAPLKSSSSAGGKSNAASQGAPTRTTAAKVLDSFAAHINENCLDETKFLSIDTSIQFSTRARERAGSRGDIHALPSKHVLGAFASLGTCSDEEARSLGSTRVAPSPTPEDAILFASSHDKEGCDADADGAYASSQSSAWGTFDCRHEDPSQLLDLLSIEELGLHSVDVGTNDDWDGSLLSAPGRGAQWAVARSMKRQRKWVVAPRLALLGGSSSADAGRCVVVSDHFSALTQRDEFQNGPSAFSGSANYELRYLRAGNDVVSQTFQLASPALHRSLATSGSFSSAGTVRYMVDGPSTLRSPLIDVATTDMTEEMMETPPISPVEGQIGNGSHTLARSSATDASSIGPITPRDLAGRDTASPFVFGTYSLGNADLGARPLGMLPRPSSTQEEERCPSPRGSTYPLESQVPDSPNLGAPSSPRVTRIPGKGRDARSSGKIERRLSDWFRKKAVPASASASAIVDLSPSQPPNVEGAEKFLVPLTRSHSRPYRKSPGPASGLILAPSEREMKLRSTPSTGNLSPVSGSSSVRGAKSRGALEPDASLVAAFLSSPRGQRRRSSSDDQVIMAAAIQRKEQERERSSGMTLSRLETYAAAQIGDATTGLFHPAASRLEAIMGSPTTSTRLDLLGLDKVPPHALTMILPLPMFGSRRNRPSRAVRISFVPFSLDISQGSPEMSSSGSRGNLSPSSERSGPTNGGAHSNSEASNSPASGSGTWYRRLAGAFRDGNDDDKEGAAAAGPVDFPPRPAAQDPVRVAHRRGSTVEAFRVTAQVFRLEEGSLAGQTEQLDLPEPTSFPIVLGMCSADRNLEFLSEGWAALGLEDGPVRLPCTAKAQAERVYAPLAGLADLVFAGCAAVMDL